MAGKENKELDYNSYLENENVQWFFSNLMSHESDKDDGVVNYGGFNQGGGDSSAFGFGQYTGQTRNEVLEKYNIDAWSEDLDTQMKAVVATLHMDGDLDHIVGGNFENVFGVSDLKTRTYPATKKSSETGEQVPHPNAGQQYKIGGSRWQAFYPEGHRDFIKMDGVHPKDTLLGQRPEDWKTTYQNQVNTAVFDPKLSFNKISKLNNGSDIQMKKRNLFNETYKNNSVPQYIIDGVTKVEDFGEPIGIPTLEEIEKSRQKGEQSYFNRNFYWDDNKKGLGGASILNEGYRMNYESPFPSPEWVGKGEEPEGGPYKRDKSVVISETQEEEGEVVSNDLNLSAEEKLKIQKKSQRVLRGEEEVVISEKDKIKNELIQEKKKNNLNLSAEEELFIRNVNNDISGVISGKAVDPVVGPTANKVLLTKQEKEARANEVTFDYNNLTKEIRDIDKKRDRRILQELSVKAGREAGVSGNDFFQTKQEYEQWYAKNNPNANQTSLFTGKNDWNKTAKKFEDDKLTAFKRGRLNQLNNAIKSVYDEDFEPPGDDKIANEMKLQVLKQLSNNDVLRLDAEDRLLFFKGVLPGMVKNNKEIIIDNARIAVYNSRQEILSEEYDVLLESSEIMKEKNILQKTLTNNLNSKQNDLEDQREDILNRGSYKYNVIGNINREQWYPENAEEYLDFQDKVKEFDAELGIYNKQKKAYDLDVTEYEGKINSFKKKSEDLQVALTYQIVDGLPIFEKSFDNWNVRSSAWQESLRNVLGKDNVVAKGVDVLAAGLAPIAGMFADLYTFSYQLGIAGAGFVTDKIVGRENGAGSNFDLVFQNMITGGKISSLIPVSQRADSQFYDGSNKDTWLSKDNNGSIYKTARLTSEMLAYPIVLIMGSKKSLLKKGLANVGKGGKKTKAGKVLKSFGKMGAGRTANTVSKSNVFNKAAWKYLGIAAVPNTAKGAKGIINSLSPKIKMTNSTIRKMKMIDITYKTQMNQNMAWGQSKGLGVLDSFALGSLMSLATGLSQAIMPDYLWTESVVGKNILEKVVTGMVNANKTIGAVARNKAKQVVLQQTMKNFAKEYLEEEVDVALQDLAKMSFIPDHSPEILDIKTQEQLIIGTTLVSGVFGSIGAVKTNREVQAWINNGYRDHAESILETLDLETKSVEEVLEAAKKNDTGSRYYKNVIDSNTKRLAELKATTKKAEQISNALMAGPDYVTDKQVDLLIKLQEAEAQKKELGKSKKSMVAAELKEVNTRIKSLNEQIESSNIGDYQATLLQKINAKAKSLTKSLGGTFLELDQEGFDDALELVNKQRKEDNDKIDEQIKALPRTKAGRLTKKSKIKEAELIDSKLQIITGGPKNPGVIYYDDQNKRHVVIVNNDAAMESMNMAVGAHELFHAILRETMIKKPELMKKMAFVLQEELMQRAINGHRGARRVLDKFGQYTGGKITAQRADEMFTIMSEVLLENQDLGLSNNMVESFKGFWRQMGRDFLGKEIIIKDGDGLVNFIKDYSREAKRGRFSKSMDKVFENGLKDNFSLTEDQLVGYEVGKELGMVEADAKGDVSEKSESLDFYDPKVVNDLGLKDETKKIVAENARLRQLVLDENIEKDGKVVASPELQMQLISNNMGAAIKLGVFAASNPKIMGLEADKRVSADEFISGYYEQLTKLAGTYDASVNEFGAYMNTILPLRYGQILKEAKKGAVEGRVSIDSEEGKELTGDVNVDQEEQTKVRKKNVAKTLGIYKQVKAEAEEGINLIKKGPAKTKKGEAERIARLQELGFADKNGVIVDLDAITYATVPNIMYKHIAKHFGVDAYKLYPFETSSKNLRRAKDKGSNEMLAAQLAIQKIGIEFFAAIMPEGHTTAYKTTGIAQTKWKVLYNKSTKRYGNDFPWFKNPVVDTSLMLDMLGIIDGKSFREERLNQQSVISLLNVVGKLMSNQVIREVNLESGDVDVRLEASLQDGLSKFSESQTFRRNKKAQTPIKQGLNTVATLMYQRGLHLYGTKDFDKEVKKIFKEVYGDTLGDDKAGKSIRNSFAKDLLGATGLLNQYALMEKNYTESGVEIQPLSEFLEKNLIEEYNDKQIYEALGLKKKKGKFTKNDFFNKKMLVRGRKHLVSQLISLESLIGKTLTIGGKEVEFTEKMAYEWLFLMEPMYRGATQVGNNDYTFKDGGYRAIKNKGSVKSGDQRSQVTTGKSDFNALVNNSGTMFKLGDIKENNQTKKRLGIKPLFKETSNSVIKEILDNKFDFSGRKAQALQAREVTKWMLGFAMDRVNDKEDSYDNKDFAQLIYSFGSNMESPSRKGAYVYGISDNAISLLGGDLNLAGSLLEYDHAKPHHIAMLKMIGILKSPKSTWDSKMDVMFGDFVVNIIPKTMDTVIKSMGMQFQVQVGYQEGKPLEDMLGIMGRIYDYKVKGDPRIRIIKSLDGKETVFGEKFTRVTKLKASPSQTSKSISFKRADAKSRQMRKEGKVKGISIWDFDDTLARSSSKVLFTAPDGSSGSLTAEQFAQVGANLLEQGYVYDFSEFSKVVDGKTGPFFEKALARAKKFGVKDQFILTARPENSNVAIYEFLKGVGLEIPFENITGLANSTPESKALWIVDKVAEGYNDIYFADDALQNVQVVEDVLNQFDIKSKVQLAKSSESIDYDGRFNRMIERKKGIKAENRYSRIKGQKRGKSRGKWRYFIPPSAEDFAGLLYNFLGKGKQGEQDMKFFKDALLDPYAKANDLINKAKQLIRNEYKKLLKENKDIRKKLSQKTPSGDFIYEDAVRVYLWTRAGYVVPGLTNTDLQELNDIVMNDHDLLNFAKQVSEISRVEEGYVKPEENWNNMGIRYDLDKLSNDIRRDEYLAEFKENREKIFGKWQNGKLVGDNMNKIEAAYGVNTREALDDILWRMENGTNRNFGSNKLVNNFMNWINGSVATTMFFNARSAILQTLSTVNFINWEDNNILEASKAFANQPQFWSDFLFLFNSDMLKQRRSGLSQDLNASELVAIVGKSKNKTLAAANYLLQKGFLPTQIADSFAIALGGASFYRNRTSKYLNEGLGQKEAEEKAFKDFGEVAEATQQSARPDMISQQQASVLGRLILAFGNTPMQYTRLQKKAFLDLINGRGSAKAHISKIIYYGFVQNLIFTALQNAMFALPFLDDDEDEELLDKKSGRMLNSMVDSTLKGIGVYGAITATVKNMFRQFLEQKEKGRRGDFAYVLIEFFNLSPPIGIKSRKIYSGLTTYKYNKKDIENGDIKLAVEMGSSLIEGTLNVPTSRLYNKINNINDATKSEYETWQRIAMFLGWSKWNLGVAGKKKKKKRKAVMA